MPPMLPGVPEGPTAPNTPMTVRSTPCEGCPVRPCLSRKFSTRSISASLLVDFITTIIDVCSFKSKWVRCDTPAYLASVDDVRSSQVRTSDREDNGRIMNLVERLDARKPLLVYRHAVFRRRSVPY